MKSISVAIALATIMLALFGATANVVADTIPLPKNDANYSYNWAGYVAVPFTSPVTSVQGNWTVPTINSSTTPNGWSAEWVGIDGLLSSTVEQIGILANGSSAYPSLPQYCAWVEMYPAPLIPVPEMPISPGDKISAQVVYQGANQFFMELQDLTTGVTLTTTQTSNGAVDRSSAEWIVEAPGTDSGVLPLADFGSVTFTGASMTLDNNEGGPIGAFPNAQFGMLSETTGAVIATTSALDVTGSSFTVTSEVPEPSTLALLACCGLIGLVARARRSRLA